jgi:anhydro-N-acetylmuramic acid kinase
MIVMGLMSGTSADGVDAVLVKILGAPPTLQWTILGHTHVAYPPELRSEIFACFRPETSGVDRLCQLNFALGRLLAEAALQAAAEAGLSPNQIDLIGSHGQTVWHNPGQPEPSTLQIGEPAVIAERTGIPVISSFRSRDMAAGGQGAPLVSYVDTLLFSHPERTRAAQNIGGISNATYLPAPGAPGQAFAFDIGPGNMLMDEIARLVSNGQLTCDVDGKLAASGQVHQALLAELMEDEFLHESPPKTTGRERYGVQFAAQVWQRAQALGLANEDLLATLTAFTAESIAQAYRQFLPHFPEEVIVGGGGVYNPTLMAELARRVAPARVLTTQDFGLGPDAKEAAAFAILAYETFHNRPSNLPAATGASGPVLLGSLTPAPRRLEGSRAAVTEARNPHTTDIDQLSVLEVVERINREDLTVAEAVRQELPAIARAVEGIAARMEAGGRLIYVGAGTSGRLGILDASECLPTYNITPDRIISLIAGGDRAIQAAVENAEDDQQAGQADITGLDVGPLDSVVGIAASGSTAYVLQAMSEAKQRGALVISLACNHPSPIADIADIAIAPVVGPEVITGSTRMKAGTAQKMVLNMISTAVMVRLGKTFSNLMVDVQASNAKLRQRTRQILMEAAQVDEQAASDALTASGGELKTAIVAVLAGISPQEARLRLAETGGRVRQALHGA